MRLSRRMKKMAADEMNMIIRNHKPWFREDEDFDDVPMTKFDDEDDFDPPWEGEKEVYDVDGIDIFEDSYFGDIMFFVFTGGNHNHLAVTNKGTGINAVFDVARQIYLSVGVLMDRGGVWENVNISEFVDVGDYVNQLDGGDLGMRKLIAITLSNIAISRNKKDSNIMY